MCINGTTFGFLFNEQHISRHCSVLFSEGHVCMRVFGATAPSGPWPPQSRGFEITHNDAPQSVGLLWTSDQFVAEAST